MDLLAILPLEIAVYLMRFLDPVAVTRLAATAHCHRDLVLAAMTPDQLWKDSPVLATRMMSRAGLHRNVYVSWSTGSLRADIRYQLPSGLFGAHSVPLFCLMDVPAPEIEALTHYRFTLSACKPPLGRGGGWPTELDWARHMALPSIFELVPKATHPILEFRSSRKLMQTLANNYTRYPSAKALLQATIRADARTLRCQRRLIEIVGHPYYLRLHDAAVAGGRKRAQEILERP